MSREADGVKLPLTAIVEGGQVDLSCAGGWTPKIGDELAGAGRVVGIREDGYGGQVLQVRISHLEA